MPFGFSVTLEVSPGQADAASSETVTFDLVNNPAGAALIVTTQDGVETFSGLRHKKLGDGPGIGSSPTPSDRPRPPRAGPPSRRRDRSGSPPRRSSPPASGRTRLSSASRSNSARHSTRPIKPGKPSRSRSASSSITTPQPTPPACYSTARPAWPAEVRSSWSPGRRTGSAARRMSASPIRVGVVPPGQEHDRLRLLASDRVSPQLCGPGSTEIGGTPRRIRRVGPGSAERGVRRGEAATSRGAALIGIAFPARATHAIIEESMRF
jgi:hypothetical protein